MLNARVFDVVFSSYKVPIKSWFESDACWNKSPSYTYQQNFKKKIREYLLISQLEKL